MMPASIAAAAPAARHLEAFNRTLLHSPSTFRTRTRDARDGHLTASAGTPEARFAPHRPGPVAGPPPPLRRRRPENSFAAGTFVQTGRYPDPVAIAFNRLSRNRLRPTRTSGPQAAA
jgi:hypothetical protein